MRIPKLQLPPRRHATPSGAQTKRPPQRQDSFDLARVPAPPASYAAKQACEGPLGEKPTSFLGPNETAPVTMKPLTTAAQAGVYVGVGTERCWMAAALNPHFSALYMVDCDGGVTHYNTLNAALIRGAQGDRQRYLHLRLHGTPEEFRAAAEHLPAHQASLLRNPEAYRWWHINVQEYPSWETHCFHQPGSFPDANYLHDDALFARLSRHVHNDTVHMGRIKLDNPQEVEPFVAQLRQRKQKISVLDISNAWMNQYMHPGGLKQLVEQLHAVLPRKSVVLGTTDALFGFNYFGMRPHTMLRNWSKAEKYLLALQDRTANRTEINGIDLFVKPRRLVP